MSYIITTDKLCKQYGLQWAVKDVSINVERGAIVGLVGKNGAGKTTLIRMLTGLVQPTSGSYKLLPDEQRTDTSVAAIVERPSVYNDMTAVDNLTAQCKLLGIAANADYIAQTLQLVGLDPQLKKRVKSYSLGMRQRLAIAMTLVGKPQVLLLDEPTNGLDPEGIHAMREIFVRLNRECGTTLLISSHILSELSKFATEFYIMDKGEILRHVTADELASIAMKRIRIAVDDADAAARALQQFGKAVVRSANMIELYTETSPTQLILSLSQAGVNVDSLNSVGDPLEDFYLDIIGDNGTQGGTK